MGMNMFAAQLAMSAAVPSSEGSGQSFEARKLVDTARSKKSFGSVLRVARQGAESAYTRDAQKADGSRLSQPTDSSRHAKRVDGQSVTRTGEQSNVDTKTEAPAVSDRPSSGTETDTQGAVVAEDAGQHRSGRSAEGLAADSETTDALIAVNVVPADVLPALSQMIPPQTQAVDPVISQSVGSEPDNHQGNVMGSVDHGDTTIVSVGSSPAPQMASVKTVETGSDEGGPVPFGHVGNTPAQDIQQNVVPVDVPGYIEKPEPPISRVSGTVPQPDSEVTANKARDDEGGPRKDTVLQEPPPPAPQVIHGERRYQPEEELSRLEGVVPRSPAVSDQSVHAKPMDTAPFQRIEPPSRNLPHENGEAPNSAPVEMHRLESLSDVAISPDAAGSQEGRDQPPSSHEMPWPSPDRDVVSHNNRSADYPAQPSGTGHIMPSQARQGDVSAVVPPDRMPPSASIQAAEPHVSQVGRAVLFQVAEPDLGHINIRVAMTKDIVHAYLSSDRPDVGQFLVNGHDRLQSALQANGLEMGQFRVDIDRQYAGRSFQQGQSQEHNRMWQPSTAGSEEDPGAARPHDYRVSGYTGMLNVVA